MTTPSDLLAVTFDCERYHDDFPRGMPMKTCLRRQLEHQEGAKPGKLGPPRRPFCAGECSVGRAHQLAAASVGIVTSTCAACGSALVDVQGTACPSCAARRLDAGKDVPRGELPAAGPAPSSRIWTGEVPDVPIQAPGKHRAGRPSAALMERREARAAERRREFEQEQDHPEEPAAPAEEETMPRGKPSEKRTCCESNGTRHLASCPTQGKAVKVVVPVTRKPGVALLAAPVTRRAGPARLPKGEAEPDFAYMAEETADDLVASVAKCKATLAALRAELLRRKGVIDAAIAEVGEEAAA